jgi:hypothetical protein
VAVGIHAAIPRGDRASDLSGLPLRPSGTRIAAGAQPVVAVGEIAPYMTVNRRTPNIGPLVLFLSVDGTVLSILSRPEPRGQEPGQVLSPHTLATDLRGLLYVGDVGRADWAS